MSPHGEGNHIPVFAIKDLQIAGKPRRIGSNGQHLSFYVKQGNVSMKAIGFGMGDEIDRLLKNGSTCSLAVVLKENNWMNNSSIELEVKDIKFDGE